MLLLDTRKTKFSCVTGDVIYEGTEAWCQLQVQPAQLRDAVGCSLTDFIINQLWIDGLTRDAAWLVYDPIEEILIGLECGYDPDKVSDLEARRFRGYGFMDLWFRRSHDVFGRGFVLTTMRDIADQLERKR